jgi:hypothetical protein
MDDASFRLLMAGLVAAVAAVLLAQAVRDRAHRRRITDLPTSNAAGVFVGLNEVAGVARAPTPLRSRFSRTPCVWHVWREEQETRRERRGDGSAGTETVWVEIGRGGEMIHFAVEDDTGRVEVNPEGAEIRGTVLADGVHGSRGGGGLLAFADGGPGATGRYRRYEAVIAVDEPVYVLGTAHLVDDGRRPRIAAEPGTPFFVTTQREDELSGMFRWRAWAMLVAAAVAAGAAAMVAAAPPDASGAVAPAVVGVAVVALVAVAAEALATWNGLVALRQRQERAWSLIDVQLRRRHDLIPRLVEAARGVAGFEADVQATLAAIRSGTWSGAHAAVPDPDEVRVASAAAAEQSAATRHLVALREAHPDLGTDTVFAQLFAELVDTEDRVAAARGYFNESVIALRQRTETFPGSLLARGGRFERRELFTLDGHPG